MGGEGGFGAEVDSFVQFLDAAQKDIVMLQSLTMGSVIHFPPVADLGARAQRRFSLI